MILEVHRNGRREVRELTHMEEKQLRASLSRWHAKRGMGKRQIQTTETDDLLDSALAHVEELRLPLSHSCVFIRRTE